MNTRINTNYQKIEILQTIMALSPKKKQNKFSRNRPDHKQNK